MQYLGGKTRLAKDICNAILKDTHFRGKFYDPFVGGASISVEASKSFKEVFASDIHED